MTAENEQILRGMPVLCVSLPVRPRAGLGSRNEGSNQVSVRNRTLQLSMLC